MAQQHIHMDKQLRDMLQRKAAEDVAAATALLATLKDAQGAQAEAVRSALPTAVGVSFLFRSKVALAVTRETGRGFVLCRLPVRKLGPMPQ